MRHCQTLSRVLCSVELFYALCHALCGIVKLYIAYYALLSCDMLYPALLGQPGTPFEPRPLDYLDTVFPVEIPTFFFPIIEAFSSSASKSLNLLGSVHSHIRIYSSIVFAFSQDRH